jgi:hypothetical protein
MHETARTLGGLALPGFRPPPEVVMVGKVTFRVEASSSCAARAWLWAADRCVDRSRGVSARTGGGHAREIEAALKELGGKIAGAALVPL